MSSTLDTWPPPLQLSKKKFLNFQTDIEAENSVNNADLSEYDFSDMIPAILKLQCNKPKKHNLATTLK